MEDRGRGFIRASSSLDATFQRETHQLQQTTSFFVNLNTQTQVSPTKLSQMLKTNKREELKRLISKHVPHNKNLLPRLRPHSNQGPRMQTGLPTPQAPKPVAPLPLRHVCRAFLRSRQPQPVHAQDTHHAMPKLRDHLGSQRCSHSVAPWRRPRGKRSRYTHTLQFPLRQVSLRRTRAEDGRTRCE